MKNSESQQSIRDALSTLMVRYPMSWEDAERNSGVTAQTLKKFAAGNDLRRIKPLLQILKFINTYEEKDEEKES